MRITCRVHVQAGQQRDGSPGAWIRARSGLVCRARQALVAMPPPAGIDLRLGVKDRIRSSGAERLVPVKPLVQVEDDLRFSLEVRVAGSIHDWYCHGLTGCSARIRSTKAQTGAAAESAGSRPGPVQLRQRYPGGGRQLQVSATTAARLRRR